MKRRNSVFLFSIQLRIERPGNGSIVWKLVGIVLIAILKAWMWSHH